jgi:hypothetical protein
MKCVQFFLLPESEPVNTDGYTSPPREGTYLELDSNFTESLTSRKVCLEPEGASLLPPDAAT